MSDCYLCSKPIAEDVSVSRDHRTPRVLLDGAQPKRKGFTFGGYLPTHEECNTQFTDETNVPTALRLLEVLHDEDATLRLQHPQDPSIPILVIDVSRFGDFTSRDLAFFKIGDFSSDPDATLPPPEAFGSMVKTNAKQTSLNVIFSVLAKSAAAHLIGKYGMAIPTDWCIHALPFIGASSKDLEIALGEPVRFAPGVQIWVPSQDGHIVVYQSGAVCVAFIFGHADPAPQIAYLESVLTPTDCWLFRGATLNHLVDSRWVYVASSVTAVANQPRNEHCGCGSGRRHKHCCGQL